ncbi:MAG: uroporphyrinogen-III synthase, partial [Desulfobulbaceae bacterium]|nr:uroporphyrinogen-III synthase [Desulfobulbaceae bacterium]
IATAEALREYGIVADLVPEEYTGDGLAASMVAQGVKGARVLIPRAKKAREILPDTLRDNGADVDVVTVYQNVRPKDYEMVREELAAGNIDMVTFTSSSTVTNFLEMLGADREKLLAGVKCAAIGPITAKTAAKHGLTIDVQPTSYTIPSMVDAIVDCYS